MARRPPSRSSATDRSGPSGSPFPRARSRTGPQVITLTTDIGWAYASQMKGVLLRLAPEARVVDLTHEVASHDVLDGAFTLRYAAVHYPPGAIHVCIVDPGVGSARRPLIVRCAEGTVLVGPDNGVLMPLAIHLGDPVAFQIDPKRVTSRGATSATFEGRDLFAPTAALLANGSPPSSLGVRVQPRDFHFPPPQVRAGGALVTVLHVDVFGNLITNLPWDELRSLVEAPPVLADLEVGGRHWPAPVVRTYSDLSKGGLGVLGSSFGLAEIATNTGRADQLLGVRAGAELSLRYGARLSHRGA